MFGDKKPSVKAKSKTDDYTEIRNKLNIRIYNKIE